MSRATLDALITANLVTGARNSVAKLREVQSAQADYTDQSIAGVNAGTVPSDGSITNAKLAIDVKVGSLAVLNTTNKSSVVSAINEVSSANTGDETGATIKSKVEALSGTNRIQASAIQNLSSGSGTDRLGWYNVVVDYGADNTGVADATTAINNAITAAISSKGTVYIPKGTYKIAGTIHWNTYVNLTGEGWACTLLKSSSASTMLDCNGQTTIKENTATISNIEFNGNGIGTTALDLQFQIMFRHHHLYIRNFTDYATKLTGCIVGEFNTCHWVANPNGAIKGITGNDSLNGTMQSNAMMFTNCLINFTTTTFAVDWSNSAGLRFLNNCTIENNGTNGNANTGFLTFSGASPTGEGIALVMDNCWAEMNKGTFLKMNDAQAENRTIISNSIIKFGSANYNVYLSGGNGNKNIVTIVNSNINDATTNVYATGANAVVEVQNSRIGNYSMNSGASYYQYLPTLV